jgi:hypothetical protein
MVSMLRNKKIRENFLFVLTVYFYSLIGHSFYLVTFMS